LPYKLNDLQLSAVTASFDSPLLISAGPGSGKTLTLVCRTVHMITSGICARNILNISFTRRASQETRERVERLSLSCGATVPDLAALTIVTFHRFCLGVLRNNSPYLDERVRDFKVSSRSDQDKTLRSCFELWTSKIRSSEAGLPVMQIPSTELEVKKLVRQCIALIGKVKANGWKTEMLKDPFHKFIFKKYNHLMRENAALDFSDFITETVKLFEGNPEILKKYQNRFQVLLESMR